MPNFTRHVFLKRAAGLELKKNDKRTHTSSENDHPKCTERA